MIILDSFAVPAFLRDEPAADGVRSTLISDDQRALTSVGLAETMDRLLRLMGADPEPARSTSRNSGSMHPYRSTGVWGATPG